MSKAKTKILVKLAPYIVASIAGLGGLATYVKKSAPIDTPTKGTQTIRSGAASFEGQDSEPKTAKVLRPKMTGSTVGYESSTKEVPKGEDARIFTVNSFLKAIPAVKPNARLIGVEVKNKVALLSFSPEFQNGYGSEDEKTIVEGIAQTLGAFPEISSYKILVDGQALDTLGHIDLSEPIPVVRSGELGGSTPSEGSPPTPSH